MAIEQLQDFIAVVNVMANPKAEDNESQRERENEFH
jgi:hypothetical protein